MSNNDSEKARFALSLRAAREAMSLSQEAFAKLGGVGKMSQYQYERGHRWPTIDYLLKLKGAGIDLVDLVHGIYRPEVMDRRALESNREVILLVCDSVNSIFDGADERPASTQLRVAATRHALEFVLATANPPTPQQLRARIVEFLKSTPAQPLTSDP